MSNSNLNFYSFYILDTDKPRSHHIESLATGDFFRPLLPGTYSVLVHKSGFHNQTETVEITADKPSVFLKLNLFLLTPKIDIEDELLEEEEFLGKVGINNWAMSRA